MSVTAPPATRPDPTPGGTPGSTPWWRRPWMVALAVIVLLFMAFAVPPYLSLDPARSRVPAPDRLGFYHPLLVAHVLFASVALLTCVFQIWPELRRRYPAAHRRTGRAYVFAGVLPAGVLAVGLGAISPFGPVARVSNVLMASLWLLCTVAGWRAARRRHHAEHRRWMIRSFALTVSIITNRIWGVVWFLTLQPQLESTFGGSQELLTQAVAGLSTWTGWVIPLLVAQWWLDRQEGQAQVRKRRSAGRAAYPAAPPG